MTTVTKKDRQLAAAFTQIILTHHSVWSTDLKLPGEEIKLIEELVREAGWKKAVVVPGVLKGRYCDTGGLYDVNKMCPLKVTSDENSDLQTATLWLDTLLRYVVSRLSSSRIDPDTLTEQIATKIEQSRPLEPIRLNGHGDQLLEYPNGMHKHGRDNDKLGCCVGVHAYCNGWMDRHRSTETHDSISCRNCHLRVRFPHAVKTYGDLRRALKN